MSTSYSASVIYGYCLPGSELIRSKPHPLWGKHKFDPDTGEKVTRTIAEDDIELALEEGDSLRGWDRFERNDTYLGDDQFVLLGIKLTETELSYGREAPQKLELLSADDCARVAAEAKKLLDKAGVEFDPECVGYHLVGYVG
jgi:hypothetical protein